MREFEHLPQQRLFRFAELGHLDTRLGAGQRGRDRDEHDLVEFVACVGGTRVGENREMRENLQHQGLPGSWESSEKSTIRPNRKPNPLNSNAIPLLWNGLCRLRLKVPDNLKQFIVN